MTPEQFTMCLASLAVHDCFFLTNTAQIITQIYEKYNVIIMQANSAILNVTAVLRVLFYDASQVTP